MESFGKRLIGLRNAAGLVQYELAQAIGVREKQISLWETGRHMPRAAQLVRLASALDVSVDRLLGVCDE